MLRRAWDFVVGWTVTMFVEDGIVWTSPPVIIDVFLVVTRSDSSLRLGDRGSGHVSEFLSLFSTEMFFKFIDSFVLIGSSLLP